jgi:hypothetical protein
MVTYRGVPDNRGHILALAESVEAVRQKGEAAVYAQLKAAKEAGGPLCSLMTLVEEDLPKALAHQGDDFFRVRESVQVSRARLLTPGFEGYAKDVLTSGFRDLIAHYAGRYERPEAALQGVEIDGVFVIPREDEVEEVKKLPAGHKRLQAIPIEEALARFPEHRSFYLDHTLVLTMQGFEAWAVAQTESFARHQTQLNIARRQL